MRAEDYGGIPITSEHISLFFKMTQVWMHAGVDLKKNTIWQSVVGNIIMHTS